MVREATGWGCDHVRFDPNRNMRLMVSWFARHEDSLSHVLSQGGIPLGLMFQVLTRKRERDWGIMLTHEATFLRWLNMATSPVSAPTALEHPWEEGSVVSIPSDRRGIAEIVKTQGVWCAIAPNTEEHGYVRSCRLFPLSCGNTTFLFRSCCLLSTHHHKCDLKNKPSSQLLHD